jgi:plasmid stabilization system protein ParE
MRIIWSPGAWADIDRLYGFLVEKDLEAADSLFDMLANAPATLLDFPRRGPRLSEFDAREVREFRVGSYLLRYELVGTDVLILRFFHAREDRL